MNRKKIDPMTEFRESMIGAVVRIETNVSTLLSRRIEDREAIELALRMHVMENVDNFAALEERQDNLSGKMKWVIGVGSAFAFMATAAVGTGLIKF
jgi:hypothetical protein